MDASLWRARGARRIPVMPSEPTRALRLAAGAAALLALAGCGGHPADQNAQASPTRITPTPDTAALPAMTTARAATDLTLDACDLLGLPTSRVIALTGATMPASVPPGGAGELSTMCSYGGPGTAADATATTDPDAPDLGTDDAEKDAEEKARRQATVTGTPSTSATSETSSAAAHPEKTPDTVTASVVAPGGDARTALAAQTTQLGALYACSGLRGPSAGPQAATPPVPGSPIEVKPDPAQVYFDCVATPTGGGTEVHTMLLAGKRLWHLAFVRPGTPRTTQSQLDALAGLHKLALQVPAS